MAVLKKSNYTKRPWYLLNKHLETIVPSIFFHTDGVDYTRERITLPDDDFLDLDWLKSGFKKLIILSHGLEGSSDRQYITRAAKYFHDKGLDILTWNCRGCSGEVNKALRTYHHGDVEDIGAVISHALTEDYEEIVLMGYSMGGNMTLNYLGRKADSVDARIKTAIGFSVPCNLEDSVKAINAKGNRFYEKRFLRKLKKKLDQKIPDHPSLDVDWDQVKDFHDFNVVFTLPIFGFESEQEFYENARTDKLFSQIKVPTLIVNAKNDPMLMGRNYPFDFAEQSDFVTLETPDIGGHVGFTLKWNQASFMETRAEEFINGLLP